MWETIHTDDIVNFTIPPEVADYQKPGWERNVWMAFVKKAAATGGADFSPLEKTIAKVVFEDQVRASDVDFGLVTVQFPSMKPMELTKSQIPEGQLRDFLLASAACFPAFKSKQIGDAHYIDGGYHDNMPINLAVSMGAEEVLAIDLDGPGIVRKEKTYGVPVRYIRSYWSLGPFLWFEPELSRRNMALGYLDAKRSYGLSEGTAYAFAPGTAAQLKKEYLAPVRRLLEKFRSWNEGIELRNQAMERTMLFRLQRALRKRRGGLRSAEELLLAGIEIAGEQLNLDPTKEYTLDSFREALRSAFRSVEPMASEALSQLRSGKTSVRELVERVLREGKLQAVSLCFGELVRSGEEKSLTAGLWNICTLAPEPFLAAACIYLVK